MRALLLLHSVCDCNHKCHRLCLQAYQKFFAEESKLEYKRPGLGQCLPAYCIMTVLLSDGLKDKRRRKGYIRVAVAAHLPNAAEGKGYIVVR